MDGWRRPRQPILGTDFAGVVEATGADVRELEPGRRVFGFDDRRMGGHGELLTIPAQAALLPIPDGVPFAHAAAAVEGAHYSLSSIAKARLAPGDRVLVYGGGGAIGSAAIQLLVAMDTAVTAVCDRHQVELMATLGATTVVDRSATSLPDMEGRFDFVYDAVGKTSFPACSHLLDRGGIFASVELGPRLENLRRAITTRVRGDRRVIFALPTGARAHVRAAGEALAAGTFKPVIDRTVPLTDIVEAHGYVDTGAKTGNVVVTLDERR